jgi:hypothetical protein
MYPMDWDITGLETCHFVAALTRIGVTSRSGIRPFGARTLALIHLPRMSRSGFGRIYTDSVMLAGMSSSGGGGKQVPPVRELSVY